jgi:hypothetical protein
MMRGSVLDVFAMVLRFGASRSSEGGKHNESEQNHRNLRAEILHLRLLRNRDPQGTQPSYHSRIFWRANLGGRRPKRQLSSGSEPELNLKRRKKHGGE